MAAAPDPSEVLLSTSGKANFQRLAQLLISGGTTLLREVFDQICKPTNLPSILKNPATEKQLKTAKLTKPQWDCLYPSAGVYGKSADFDVTLLFRLLRTICNLTSPSTGWDALPASTDHSLAADLARIKYYRNSVYGHVNQTMEVTDDEFLSLWQEISEALIRIAGQISPPKKREWQLAIINFLKKPLTAEDERNVQELKEWYRNDMEVKESIEELKSSTHEVQSGLARLETTVQEKVKDMEDKLGEEAREIKGQLEEVKDRLNSSTGGTGVPGAVRLRVRIDCETSPDGGSSVGAAEMIVASQGPQAGTEKSAVVPIASGQLQTEATEVSGVASSGNHELPSPQGVLSLIALKYFQSMEPSNAEEFNGYLHYLKEVRNLLLVDAKLGSLLLTVECGSLEILEGLWKDYCAGYLNEMAQKYLVTEKILKEFGLAEVKLTTTILEEEYRACREYFLQHSALLTNNKESDSEMTSGGIQVFAKDTLTGNELRLNVLPSNTIKDVKNKIHEKTEIPFEDMRLFCAGKLLADNYTLIDYNFHKNSSLHLAVERSGIQVFAKEMLTGKELSFNVLLSNTIKDVKNKIYEKTEIPFEDMRLFCAGKLLEDNCTLTDYNFHKNSSLSSLHLAVERSGIQVFAKEMLTGKELRFNVLLSNTIKDVKNKIHEETEIPLKDMRLFCAGKLLEDNYTLIDYNFHKQIPSALHLAVVHSGVAMEIHVKIPSGGTITLTVFPEDTILQVKRNLANKTAIRSDLQLLTFDGKELGEDLTLGNHSIQNKSILHLARRSGTTMPIHVRVPPETTITLDVLPSTTIRDIKAMIAEKQDIPLIQQRLIFLDKELYDELCLSDYNIKKESTLDLIH